jgi:hypothetical protein
MVFFIVACHLANKEEEETEGVLRTQISGGGTRALGEIFSVDVSISLSYNNA